MLFYNIDENLLLLKNYNEDKAEIILCYTPNK